MRMFKKLLSAVLSVIVLLTEMNFSVVAGDLSSENTDERTSETVIEELELLEDYDQSVIDEINNNIIILDNDAENNISEQEEDETSTYSLSTYSETDAESIIDAFKVEPVNSPFNFFNNEEEAVSLATGGMNYNKNLLSLPGRNDLDLNIGIRYSSDDAVITKNEFKEVYENDIYNISNTINFNNFAIGWSFNLPTIDTNWDRYSYESDQTLILNDGSSYRIEYEEKDADTGYSIYKLNGYYLDDMKLILNSELNQYVLSYSNGIKEYFNRNGLIVKREDRFGNCISFEYDYLEYFRGSFDSYNGNPDYYKTKLCVLSKITDSIGREIIFDYTIKNGRGGNYVSKIEIKMNDNVYATLKLKSIECYNGRIDVLESIADGEGFCTSFEYQEKGVNIDHYNEVDYPVYEFFATALLMKKVTYPTGGYTKYTYHRARRSFAYQGGSIFSLWYEVYKVASRVDSEGNEINYLYDGDRSGYPYSHTRNDVYSIANGNIVDPTVQYHTIVIKDELATIHTFNYCHNKISEKTIPKTDVKLQDGSIIKNEVNPEFDYVVGYGDTQWNVIVNNELYRVCENNGAFIYQEDIIIGGCSLGDGTILSVKTWGNFIYVFLKVDSETHIKIFDTNTKTWTEGESRSGTSSEIYYANGVFFTYYTNGTTLYCNRYFPSTNVWRQNTTRVESSVSQHLGISGAFVYYLGQNNQICRYDIQNNTVTVKTFPSDLADGIGQGFPLNNDIYMLGEDGVYKFDFENTTNTLVSAYPFTKLKNQTAIKSPDECIYFFSKYNGEDEENCVYSFNPAADNEEFWQLIAYRLYGNNSHVIMGDGLAYVAIGTSDDSEHLSGFEKINFTPDSMSVSYYATNCEYNNYNQIISKKAIQVKQNKKKVVSEESWSYAEKKNLITSYTDTKGNVTLYEYENSEYNLPTKIVNYANSVNELITTYELSEDSKKILSSVTEYDEKSLKTAYSYDAMHEGNVVSESTYEIVDNIASALNTIEYVYDELGAFIVQKTFEDVLSNSADLTQKTSVDITNSFTYNELGLVTSETDANGNITRYTYNKNGWIASAEYPDASYLAYNYDFSDGVNKVTTTHNMGYDYNTIDYFDGLGRVILQSENVGGGKEIFLKGYIYSGDDLCEVYDANDNHYYYQYDAFNRLVDAKVCDNQENVCSYLKAVYDDYNLQKRVDSNGVEQIFYYDDYNRLIKEQHETDGGTSITTYSYDFMDNIIKVTDANNNDITNSYNDMGQLLSVTNQLNHTTSYEYDSFGNINKITYDDGVTNSYEYDSMGRMQKSIDAAGNIEHYSYDNNGNMITHKDKKGQITEYEYDAMNRTSRRKTGELEGEWIYDSFDLPYSYYDAEGETSYSHYGNFRLSSILKPDGKSISYEYDDCGNVTKMTDYDGNVYTYTYSALGLVKMIKKDGTLVANYSYDSAGRISSVTYPSGSTEYFYGPASEITGVVNRLSDGTIINQYNYIYDVVGNQIETIETIDDIEYMTTYTYDALNRLISETIPDGTVTRYTYNNSDNMTAKSITHPTGFEYTYYQDGTEQTITDVTAHNYTYTYNNLDQLLSVNEQITGSSNFASTDTYTYDANGNTLSKQTAGSRGTSSTQYAYNAWNQLTQFTAPDSTVTTYSYDGTGMRVSKTQGDTVKKFYWDRGRISDESTNGIFTTTNYIGPEGIFARETADDTDYMLRNGHGDIVASISEEDFTVTKTYDYDAYGVERNPSDSDNNPFRYCGEYYDEESGLIYLRNRYYDPSIGRFITEDPVKDGTNWYIYCGNNPVSFVDPNGLSGIKTDGTYYITHPLDKKLLKLKQEYGSATPKRQAQIAVEAQNIRNSGTEGVDWSVRADRTLNYYMIDTDVTKKLNDVIKSSESENWWKRFGEVIPVTNAARYVDFALMVRPGGKYDLKSKSEWQGKEHFIYNGEIIWYDEPGNILYGHLGKVMGFEDVILKSAGGAVQIATRHSSWSYVSSYFDDPRDQKAIQKGIDIFKNTHSWIWW